MRRLIDGAGGVMGETGVNSGNATIVFDAFRFDPRTGELWKGNSELRLTPRAAAVLALLADRSPNIVTKQELLALVWNGRATGDEAITSCIRELRRVLGDNSRKPRFIETRHRRGYRLVVAARSADGECRTVSPFDKPSVAVLPFRNLSGDPHQDSLVSGFAEDVATALSRCSDLAVIAYGSALRHRIEPSELADSARELGVGYLLAGSFRRNADRARICARLLSARSGEQLWAERYDSDMRDILVLQDDIARQIVATIAPEVLRAEERRVARLPLDSLRAYELSLQAQMLACQGDGAPDTVVATRHRDAVKLAEKALSLDVESPFAYAALALAYACLPEHLYFQADSAATLDKAACAATELRRIDPTSYVSFYVAGKICLRRQQAEEALVNLRRAHELNPNHCDVLRWLALAERSLGLGAEAHEHCLLALRLSPRDPRRYLFFWGLAWASFVSGRPGEGVEWATKSIQDSSSHFPTYGILAACLAEIGELQAARETINHLLLHRPAYIRSRLEGNTFLGLPELRDRYTRALRLAAGPLTKGASAQNAD